MNQGMGRTQRLRMITEILRRESVRSQVELLERLAAEGIRISQATLSRDLADLHVMKRSVGAHETEYALDAPTTRELGARDPLNGVPGTLERLSSSLVLHVVEPRAQIVVKCTAGAAQVIASALESSRLPHVVGCVAGNDTVVVFCDAQENAAEVRKRIAQLAQVPFEDD